MAGFGTLSPGEEAEVPPNILDKLVAAGIKTAATLPQRAIQNSQFSMDTGNYDPATTVEAATLPLGTGAIAGVPVRAGEVALGSGALRRLENHPAHVEALQDAYHAEYGPDQGEAAYQAYLAAHGPADGTYSKPIFTPGGSRIVNAGVNSSPNTAVQTVADPHRMMFPGVYGNPREIATEAAARVGEEDPAMKQLFGVTRGDLRDMAQDRVGNEDPNLRLAKNPSGSRSAQNIQTPRNTQRLIDILDEAGKHEGLRTADAWYIQDPMYQRLAEMYGPEEAKARYSKLNTMTGMASPGSDVMSEIQRGTGAHWLANEGRFEDFKDFAGLPEELRARMGNRVPADMNYIGGHPYHMTAQGGPMQKYLNAGSIQSDAPKVPLYVHASGVPETGFQTSGPVGDAHFSRGVGLSDTRKGPTDVGGSFSRAEYQTLQPWWQHDVAGKVGLESVPAQARLWTALGPQTGVESELGAPKLELMAKQITRAARRLGVSPEAARDLVLSGKAGAGLVAGGVVGPAAFGSLIHRDQQ